MNHAAERHADKTPVFMCCRDGVLWIEFADGRAQGFKPSRSGSATEGGEAPVEPSNP